MHPVWQAVWSRGWSSDNGAVLCSEGAMQTLIPVGTCATVHPEIHDGTGHHCFLTPTK